MKTKSAYDQLYGLIKPGTPAATVMISGFWASLVFALYYVSGALFGAEPNFLGLLFFALFAAFFLLRCFGPWSKLAALLGFCSLAVVASFFAYLVSRLHFVTLSPSTFMAIVVSSILLSVGLALAGVLLDAAKYLRWVRENNQLLNLKDTVLTVFRCATYSKCYDYSI